MHLYYPGSKGQSWWRAIIRQGFPETLKQLVIALPSPKPLNFAQSPIPPLLFSQCPVGLQELRFHFGYRHFNQRGPLDEEDLDTKIRNSTQEGTKDEGAMSQLPSMRSLKVTCEEDDPYPPSFPQFLERCNNLHTLHVSSIDESWTPTLAACGSLKTLQLSYVNTVSVRLLGAALKDGLPNLDEIHLHSDVWDVYDIDVATMLSAGRAGWRSIDIDFLGYHSAAALIEHHHFLTLELFKMSETYDSHSLTNAQMVKILGCSPNLHTFEILSGFSVQSTSVPFFLADEFFDLDESTEELNPWLCESTLKYFCARIVGIPRPELKRTFHGHPLRGGMVLQEDYPGQSQEYQRRVYERLSRLTRLERLELGNEDRNFHDKSRLKDTESNVEELDDVYHQYSCLEMSLWSGLGVLEGLKELKELIMMRMATLVGVEDVKWMVRSWPKLRLLRGLNYSSDAEVESQTWLCEKYPGIKLESCKRGVT
ncbi:hypothetical protein BGZ96_012809 [Linnemannia gamsii]|uniref:Uncharacterized protein n=1 Tax=Linnemannia gamsii TaxID=64522 RepID=A0ABQ7JQC4_9FUNG|nr:hypothetical protein BGZ96_012809 [Linnemannia gamsii]